MNENEAYTNEAMEDTMRLCDGNCSGTSALGQIDLGAVAAGTLNRTVDTAVAVSQFAVGAATGIGLITLGSVNNWFTTGTESVNTQFSAMVNRIFGVKKS